MIQWNENLILSKRKMHASEKDTRRRSSIAFISPRRVICGMRSSFHSEQTTAWYASVVFLLFAAWNVLTRIRVSSKRNALDAWFLHRVGQRTKDGVRFDCNRDKGARLDLNKVSAVRSYTNHQKGQTMMCQYGGPGSKRGTNSQTFLRTFLVRWNASVKLLGTRRETASNLVCLLRERFDRTRLTRMLNEIQRLTKIGVQMRKRNKQRMLNQWTGTVSILAIGRFFNKRRNMRQMRRALTAFVLAASVIHAPELHIPNELRRAARSAILNWYDAAYELF